jgi:hypothetical protein
MEPNPTFEYYNVDLPDGARTMGDGPLVRELPHVKAVLRTLDVVYPRAERAAKCLVDLGCLEGGLSVEFARAGFDVTGIEVRPGNIARCEWLRQRAGLDNLRFVLDDVRNIDRYGPFDATYCGGILYHLDQPTAFLHALSERTRRLLVLDTHYATRDSESVIDDVRVRRRSRHPRVRSRATKTYGLSPLCEHEGSLGRWYTEHPADSSPAEMEASATASYGNTRSFWIEKKHLIQTLLEVGFHTVYEQYDFLERIASDTYQEDENRGIFVALR